jgi:hypothetical protein
MALGIVNAIKWFLGLDEELEKLRQAFRQVKDNTIEEIKILKAKLEHANTECNNEIQKLQQTNQNHVSTQEQEIKKLQAQLLNIQEQNARDHTALEQSSIKLSLKLNTTISTVDSLKSIVDPITVPLLTAPFWNYTERVVTKLKTTVNRDGRFGTQSMHLAVEKGQPQLIELLFKLGIPSGYLETAYNSGKIETVVKIIEFEVNKKHPNNYNPHNLNDNPVHRLCREDHGIKHSEKCEENAILKLKDYDYLPPKENSLICYAAKKGFIKVIHEIFKSQPKFDIDNSLGCAIAGMRIDSVAKLLDLVPDTNISKFGIAIAYDGHSISANECRKEGYYSKLYHAKDDIERALQYKEIKSKGCQHGIGDFLYIVQLLQASYGEDQSIIGIHTDGSINIETN